MGKSLVSCFLTHGVDVDAQRDKLHGQACLSNVDRHK